MRKLNLFLMLPLLLLTSCNLPSLEKHEACHGAFVKRADYLYEVTYTDYSYNDVIDWQDSYQKDEPNPVIKFAGSSLHNGNYFGHSFDASLTNMSEFVVRTPKTNSRFSSIGISISDGRTNPDQVENKNEMSMSPLVENLLPYTIVDGINENGVVCSANIVPTDELISNYKDDQYHTLFTKKSGQDLYYQFVPRFVLDNAKSASHAIELLAKRNIKATNSKGELCDYYGIREDGYELHYMIADKNDTYVVELVDNEIKIVHSGAHIMTNFYLSTWTVNGFGITRFNKLDSLYDNSNSYDGMFEAINAVSYSKVYEPNSDFYDEKAGLFIYDNMINNYNAKDILTSDEIKTQYEKDQAMQLEIINSNDRSHNEDAPLISYHACIYEIETCKLTLFTQEKYDRKIEYIL